jgi:NhaP-type Na+/H+ or K+/H+ antiporter
MTAPAMTPARLAAGLLAAGICLALGLWVLWGRPLATAVPYGVGGAGAGLVLGHLAFRSDSRRGPNPPKRSPLTQVLGLAAGVGAYLLARRGGAVVGPVLMASAAFLLTIAWLGWTASRPPDDPPPGWTG